MAHPGNEALFDVIVQAVQEQVHTRPGHGWLDHVRGRLFTENGGSLYYEFVATSTRGGLVEAGTPECRGPAQLLLYQRAQEQLLTEAAERAEDLLARRGTPGELGLLKNCRDAFGHIYGAQENYAVPIAQGWRLAGWRCAVLAAVPFALVAGLVHWILVAVTLALCVPVGIVGVVAVVVEVMLGLAQDEGWATRALDRGVDAMVRLESAVMGLVLLPCTLILGAGVRLFAFRGVRRTVLPFLASRCIVSGAGSQREDGTWALSEKADAIRRLARWSLGPDDRGWLEIGHLIKPMGGLAWGDWRAVVRLLEVGQRLQLGLSDANRCDVAEYLKVGTTALVLDMAEAGVIDDLPRLARPIQAMQALSSDPSLLAEVALTDGTRASALQLQRWYLERARGWLETGVASLEAHHLLRLWARTLDALERDREELVGQIDWITKRELVARAGGDDPDAQKKIDLRYHELGRRGYHQWLADAGLVTRLVSDDEACAAKRRAPEGTPARQRGALVRALSETGTNAQITWDRVRVGGALRGRVIQLDRHRDKP